MAERETAAGRPARLPRGRHGLSRQEVALDQRTRMLLAMAEAVSRKGFVGTTVADVIKGAGVSRETFYQQFSDKLDCYLHAFDAAATLLLDQVRAEPPAPPADDPVSRLDRAIGRYLDALAAQPAMARVFLVEVYAAGPEALARRAELQASIVDEVARLLEVPADDADGRFACALLVAGVSAMVTGPLVAGDLDGLGALREPLVRLVRRALATPG